MKRLPKRRGLLAGLGILIACAGLALLWAAAPDQQLAAARRRWQAHPIAHYQLAFAEQNGFYACREAIAVRGEQVETILQSTCPADPALQPPTVTHLFQHIAATIADWDGFCGGNGCGCAGPARVQARYDPGSGYPQEMDVRTHPEERLLHPNFWPRVLTGADCHRDPNAPTPITHFTVRSLTVLP